jgi:hypothetical protein
MPVTLNENGLVTSDGSTIYSYDYKGIGSYIVCSIPNYLTATTQTLTYGAVISGSNLMVDNTISGWRSTRFGSYTVETPATLDTNIPGSWRSLGSFDFFLFVRVA